MNNANNPLLQPVDWELILIAKEERLEMDNILVENSIRPSALSSKNYLSAGPIMEAAMQRCFIPFWVVANNKILTPLFG